MFNAFVFECEQVFDAHTYCFHELQYSAFGRVVLAATKNMFE